MYSHPSHERRKMSKTYIPLDDLAKDPNFGPATLESLQYLNERQGSDSRRVLVQINELNTAWPFPTKKEEPKTFAAHSFLEKAGAAMKQRAEQRDKPQGERSMAGIVKTFNSLTGHSLTEAEGWEFMVILKMVRGRQGNFNDDDYVDGAAYFGLLGECESTRERGR